MNDHRKIDTGYRVATGIALFAYVAGSSFYIVREHLEQHDQAQVDVNVVISMVRSANGALVGVTHERRQHHDVDSLVDDQ